MAIREKLRAKFSSKNKTPPPESSSDEPHPEYFTGRTDIEYYKPHEIPKSKYRGRVDKDHQDKLEAFSFEDAFQIVARRSSAALSGTFSPGGTKSFSRRTSYASNVGHTPARSRRSSLSSDANASFSVPSSESASTHMRSIPAVMTSTKSAETADDSDGTNTGLSKIETAQDSRPQSRANGNIPVIRLDREATVTEKISGFSNSHIEHSQPASDLPFSPEELTQAMSKATITPQTTMRRTSVAVA